MKYRSLLVAVLAIFCFSTGALALDKGPWELTMSGSGNNDKDFEAGAFGINLGLGYFLNDNFELGFRQSAAYADTGDDSSWNASSRGALDFHFTLGNFRPFIGGNVGFVYGDNVKDTWEAAPEAGVKWFANDTTFILAMVEYQFFFVDTDAIDTGFDDGQFVYTIGIGFRF